MLIEAKRASIGDLPPQASPVGREAYFFIILIGLSVIRLWILPLRTGFWLDETGTFWAASGTLEQAFSRSVFWPSQFPLYSAIAWLALHAGGPRELMMRLPSVFAMGLAAYLLYRLASRILNRKAALPAVLIFASLETVAFAAADARPYAIGLTAVIGAMLFLIRWIETERLAFGLAYAVCAALTWHMQYVFVTTFIVHAVYVLFKRRRDSRPRISQIFAVSATAIVLALPSLPHVIAMSRTAGSHAFAGSPSLQDLFTSAAPPALVCGLICGLVLAWAFGQSLQMPALKHDSLVLIALWLVIPCLVPFAIASFSGAKIFLPRYLLPSAPALALAAGVVIAAIPSPRFQTSTAALTFAALLFSSRGLSDFSHGGDWRKAIATVHVMTPETPILFRSGFPESQPFDWLDDRARRDYLLAPLTAYPAQGTIFPLPFRLDARAKARLEEILPSLTSGAKFALIEMGDTSYDFWIAGRTHLAGFTQHLISRYGGPLDSLRVVIFEKSPNPSGAGR